MSECVPAGFHHRPRRNRHPGSTSALRQSNSDRERADTRPRRAAVPACGDVLRAQPPGAVEDRPQTRWACRFPGPGVRHARGCGRRSPPRSRPPIRVGSTPNRSPSASSRARQIQLNPPRARPRRGPPGCRIPRKTGAAPAVPRRAARCRTGPAASLSAARPAGADEEFVEPVLDHRIVDRPFPQLREVPQHGVRRNQPHRVVGHHDAEQLPGGAVERGTAAQVRVRAALQQSERHPFAVRRFGGGAYPDAVAEAERKAVDPDFPPGFDLSPERGAVAPRSGQFEQRQLAARPRAAGPARPASRNPPIPPGKRFPRGPRGSRSGRTGRRSARRSRGGGRRQRGSAPAPDQRPRGKTLPGNGLRIVRFGRSRPVTRRDGSPSPSGRIARGRSRRRQGRPAAGGFRPALREESGCRLRERPVRICWRRSTPRLSL
ncbi:hypothetical protein A4R44_03277 [Amycolatopsis sp. M39]|nr:hypothetical protein A4R44_03277 [Amycolatopsis sp. M39]